MPLSKALNSHANYWLQMVHARDFRETSAVLKGIPCMHVWYEAVLWSLPAEEEIRAKADFSTAQSARSQHLARTAICLDGVTNTPLPNEAEGARPFGVDCSPAAASAPALFYLLCCQLTSTHEDRGNTNNLGY